MVKTCQALIPGPFPELLVPTGKVVSLLQAKADVWLCLCSIVYSECASFPNLHEDTVRFSTSPTSASGLVHPRLCAAGEEIMEKLQW